MTQDEITDKFLQGEDYRVMYLKVRDELAELQQRTWVGLTDEEVEIIYAECNVWDKFEYERMLEAKLKEKNT